jgi:sulfur carrier protein
MTADAVPLGLSVVINGVSRTVADGTTVDAIVTSLVDDSSGCAVAVNDAVVPRSDWRTRALEADDRVEVLTAVQGG